MRDIEKVLTLKVDVDSTKFLLKKYHEFLNVFLKKNANQLSSHRLYDHKISLKLNLTSSYQHMYEMLQVELQVVKQYIKENLSKEFIRVSSFSVVAFILFVKKSEENLRLCVDYRKLNEITEKNRYFLSLIKETLSRVYRVKIFLKIDIVVAFNRL